MARIISKLVLMLIVLVTIGLFCVSVYSAIKILTNEEFAQYRENSSIQYASLGVVIFLILIGIGAFVYHVRTFRTISKIYNVYNRDIGNPRPVNRNFETKIYKIDLVSAILWIVGCAVMFLSTAWSTYQYSKLENPYNVRMDETLYWLLLFTLIILAGSIIELLSTRSYIQGYTYLDDEIESIGE